jgi:histidinol dehydrogenase
MEKDFQKGISLYLSLVIITAVMAAAMGVSSIFLGQAGLMREMGYSVIAFYAADAGVEEVLLSRNNPSSVCLEETPCQMDNGAEYYIIVKVPGADCDALYYCIKSVGMYKETKRAIEISY